MSSQDRPKHVPTRIKICGMTRPEDAVAAAYLGAHAIGLVFYSPSPRCVSVDQARAIVRALPPFVTSVGLFVNPDEAAVRAVLDTVPLALLQFHGDEPPGFCEGFGRPYIKAVAMAPGVDLLQSARLYAGASGLLVDAFVPGVPGGTGVTVNWRAIPAGLSLPLILAGGLDSANVEEAVRTVRPWAVDVASGVERSKGVKDHDKIAAFVRGVQHADV